MLGQSMDGCSNMFDSIRYWDGPRCRSRSSFPSDECFGFGTGLVRVIFARCLWSAERREGADTGSEIRVDPFFVSPPWISCPFRPFEVTTNKAPPVPRYPLSSLQEPSNIQVRKRLINLYLLEDSCQGRLGIWRLH